MAAGAWVAPLDPPPTGILAYLRWMSCVKLLMGIMSHSSYASFMYAKSVKLNDSSQKPRPLEVQGTGLSKISYLGIKWF